jgi:hypothetical protein
MIISQRKAQCVSRLAETKQNVTVQGNYCWVCNKYETSVNSLKIGVEHIHQYSMKLWFRFKRQFTQTKKIIQNSIKIADTPQHTT